MLVEGVDHGMREGRIVDVGVELAHVHAGVERVAERLVTIRSGGRFRAAVYRNAVDGHEHIAMVKGTVEGREGVLVRLH